MPEESSVKMLNILSDIGFKKPMKIFKMSTGSSSENYHVINSQGNFLVKFLKNGLKSNILFSNLSATSGEKYCPVFLYREKLQEKDIFIFQWIEGKNIFLEKLSDEDFKNLILSYQLFLTIINTKLKMPVLHHISLQEQYNSFKENSFFGMNIILREIKKDLLYAPKLKIIHGDLNFKNLIFNGNQFQTFLDFQEFSWGCPTEDLIRLLLTNAEQHQFFRKKGTLRLLKIILKNTQFSKSEWLYGLDRFILTKYERKLKKKRFLGILSICRCNILYNNIRKVIALYYK